MSSRSPTKPVPTRADDTLWRVSLWLPLLAVLLALTTALVWFAGSRRVAPRIRLDAAEEMAAPVPSIQPQHVHARPASRAATITPHSVAPAASSDAPLDPEAQAMLDQLVEEDQLSVQPEDLELDPQPKALDLRTIKAYRDLNIDADGNLN